MIYFACFSKKNGSFTSKGNINAPTSITVKTKMNQFSLLECKFVTTVCNLRQTIYKYCCRFQQKIILNCTHIFSKKKMLDLNNGCLHIFLQKKPEYRYKRSHIISTCIYKLGVMVDRLSMGVQNNRVVNMKTISNQYFHAFCHFITFEWKKNV